MFFECSIDWCDRPVHSKGYCGAHYQRSVRGADMNAPHREKRSGACRASGCDRPDSTGGFCAVHYWRKRKGRDMDAPIRLKQKVSNGCVVFGCAEPHLALGYCEVHYTRLKRFGSTEDPMLHAEVSFTAAHQRCHRMWGRAAQYPCIKCGLTAAHWAYDGTDSSQLFGYASISAGARRPSKLFYSRYPEFYMPMCVKCHSRKDGETNQRELEEYRELKHQFGLTHDEILSRVSRPTLLSVPIPEGVNHSRLPRRALEA